MIPGRLLHRVAMAWCSADMRERVVEPLLADCQYEWLGASTLGGRLSVVARYWTAFWMALVGCLAHDVRHDIGGCAKRVAPAAWVGFWVTVLLIELPRSFRSMSVYLPALAIVAYRMKASERRSWAGLAWSVGLMAAFLAARGLFPEFRFIFEWAAGACVSASWTFLVKKEPSVVEATD